MVSAVTGGALLLQIKNQVMFLELLKGRFKNIKRLSQRWRLFSLFSYDKYKSFWEPYNKKLESSKKYDKLSTKEIDSENC